MASEIVKAFSYRDMLPHLRVPALQLYRLARLLDIVLLDCAEKSDGMRKLLEAKDCFVRAKLRTKLSEKPKSTDE